MELNDAGDFELLLCDGQIIAKFTDEGVLIDWWNDDGITLDRTLALTWEDLYDNYALPGGNPPAPETEQP